MTAIVQNRMAGILNDDATWIRKNWSWFLVFGIIQIIAGIFAVGFAFSATVASVEVIGVLLLVAAGAQTAAAIMARDWGGFFLFLLLGVLYWVAGFMALLHPVAAAESLTLMLAALFVVGGFFRIVVALVERFPSWGWVLFNGVVTVLLGIAIWQQRPTSGLWVLGTIVGIDFIINGVTWSTLAVGVRNGVAQLTGR